MLIESNVVFEDLEANIGSLLAGAEDLDSNVHFACGQFGVILDGVLRLLPGNQKWRYWFLDDFDCNRFCRRDQIVTLLGSAYWLSGGEECDSFRLDIALDKEPLLYSYKFTKSKSGEQMLYIGKTPDGWVVNGT